MINKQTIWLWYSHIIKYIFNACKYKQNNSKQHIYHSIYIFYKKLLFFSTIVWGGANYWIPMISSIILFTSKNKKEINDLKQSEWTPRY